MAFPTAHYADSDADDEYERSVLTSPHLHTDDDTSPTDSDPPSTEPTPTFGHHESEKMSPVNQISEWTASQCADYLSSLGLSQYCDNFIENEIVGEALVALRHEELKEMSVKSVGHRLTILKGVYDIKIKQEIPFNPDHYIPPSADASVHDQTATQDDISRIIKSIESRDRRIHSAEAELRKLTDDYRKLRDELLPVFRLAKDQSQPLPYPGSSPSLTNGHEDTMTPMSSSQMSSQMAQEKGAGVARNHSIKRPYFGTTPKTNSPTHIPPSIPEGKQVVDATNLDPSAAAVAASSHLSATVNGGSQPAMSPNQISIPSPTSPNTYIKQTQLPSRSYGTQPGMGTNAVVVPAAGLIRPTYPHHDEQSLPHTTYTLSGSTLNDRSNASSTASSTASRMRAGRDGLDEGGSGKGEPPSVEIFKSFKVSMEDPCYRVLPAALRKYNINADWRQYALYIVHGDMERCLGLEEKPLILFKQLDREGRKPMFMLRKHAAPMEGHSGPSATGGGMMGGGGGGGGVGGLGGGGLGGMDSSMGLGGGGGGRGLHAGSIQLPGGVI